MGHDIPNNLTPEVIRREYERGAFGKSMVWGEHLLKKKPNDPNLLSVVGFSHLHMGRFDRARQRFEALLRIRKGDANAINGLVESYKYQNRFDAAHRVLDEALSARPTNGTLLAAKAEVCQVEGRNDEAIEFAEKALADDPSSVTASTALTNAVKRREDKRGEAIDILRTQASDASLILPMKTTVYYSLGTLLDAEGEYDEAFEAYRNANEVRPTTFNREAFEHEVEQTIANWTEEAIAEMPRIEPRHGNLPVFIVGMPRSGTSLVEQIIGAHPEVHGAGELNTVKVHGSPLQGSVEAKFPILTHTGNVTKSNLEKFARKVLADLRKLAPKANRVTDKMPENSIRLNLIAMGLPQSTIIHTLRNPVDTCLSCYFQAFGPGVRYATRLDALGIYYSGHRRLMDHWKNVLPIEIHDVEYETLTRDQEGETRRLINACGLEWDDACLRYYESGRVIMTASNEQVRQPIYRSSVDRWRRYEKHLGPLLEALGEHAPST